MKSFTSLVQLVHLFEAGMVERRWGRILNVASLAGLVPHSRGSSRNGHFLS
jgi:short-subunit dehydrogenase